MSNSSAYAQYLTRVNSDLSFNLALVLAIIGIPSNCLAAIIFVRLSKNKTNMGFLYIWQCLIDIFIQVFILLIYQSRRIFGMSLNNQSNSMCMFITFLQRFVPRLSSWLTVLITFERFIFVLYDHKEKYKLMKSKLFLTGIIFVIFVFIAISSIPSLFYYMKAGSCTADFAIVLSSDISSIFMRVVAPFLLTLTFNVIMIRKIIKSKRTAKPLSQNNSRKENDFTLSVMAYDIYFLILNIPLSIYLIMYDINTYSGALNSSNDVYTASYAIASTVANYSSFCVQTFSFFTYVFFNKLFRLEFYSLLSRVFCFFNWSNRVSPNNDAQLNGSSNN